MPRCPGQDLRFWTPNDIFDVMCFNCGAKIEFWKDEPSRICPGCSREVHNPRIDLGCAKWCRFAKECIGKAAGDDYKPVAPVIDRLELLLEGSFAAEPDAVKRSARMLKRCEPFLQSADLDPCILQCAAMLTGGLLNDAAVTPQKLAGLIPLLERTGLDRAAAQKVCSLVLSVLGGGTDKGPEYQTLCDLAALENLATRLQYTFKTELGAKLAKLM